MASTLPPLPVDGDYKTIDMMGWDPTTHGYALPETASVATDSTYNSVPYAPLVTQLAKSNYALAAGSGSTAITIKATPGYIHNFIVTTTATAALTFYDNASAASGTVIYTTSSTIAAGTIIVLDMPFMNGLTVSQASGTMGAVIGYN